MAKAYWMASVDVNDPELYKEYVRLNAAAFQKYGAKFLVRGGEKEVVEGKLRDRVVVIEFEDYDTAMACYHSSEYAAAMDYRKKSAVSDVVVVHGYDGQQPTD